MMPDSWKFGFAMESRLVRSARARGFDAVKLGGLRGGPDAIISGFSVELKSSRLRKLADGRLAYQFLLFKAGRSSVISEDIVCLACVNSVDVRWIFVPSSEICSVHCVSVCGDLSKYRGRFLPYLDAWHTFQWVT